MNRTLLMEMSCCILSVLLSAFLIGFQIVKGNIPMTILVSVCLVVSILVLTFIRKLKPQRIFEWCGIMVLIFIISLSVGLKSVGKGVSTEETKNPAQDTTEKLVTKNFKVEIAKSDNLFEETDKSIEEGETIKVEVKFEFPATLTTESLKKFIYIEGANYELLDENFTPERMNEDFTIKLKDITSEKIVIYIQPGLEGLLSKERVLSEKSNELTYQAVVKKVEIVEETSKVQRDEKPSPTKQPITTPKEQKVETPKVETVEEKSEQTIEQPKTDFMQDPTAELPAETVAPVKTPKPTPTPSPKVKTKQYYGDPTANGSYSTDQGYGDPTTN